MMRQFYHYFLYFGSMIFSVTIFFTFVSIQYNRQAEQAASDSVKIGASFQAASVVLILFVSIFVWYSNSFFTKRRKKEIGLYALLGLRRRQIGRMLFYENMILGLLSLTAGILIGILLSKFFIMILMRMMGTIVAVGFTVSLPAIIETAIVFFVIILIASLYGYRLIYRFQLVELFHAGRVGDRAPNVSAVQALLAVLLIGGGYWLALQGMSSSVWKGAFYRNALIILFCVIVGTFLLFRSLTVFFLKLAKQRKGWSYRGTHLIGFSSLFYRIRGNARVLTVIATLSAVTLCAIGASFSYYFEIRLWTKQIYPFSYLYSVSPADQHEADRIFQQQLKADGKHRVTVRATVPVIIMKGTPLEENRAGHEEMVVLAESGYNELAEQLGAGDRLHVEDDQAIMLAKYYETDHEKRYIGQSGRLTSDDHGQASVVFSGYKRNEVVNNVNHVVVVSDPSFQERVRRHPPINMTEVDVTDEEHSGVLTDRLERAFNRLPRSESERTSFVSFYAAYHTIMSAYGMLLFLGAFLGLVFLLATGSIITFKQLTEAEQEKGQYAILKKIGLTAKEIRQTIARQVGFIFALPLVAGLTHSVVALTALSKMMGEDIRIPVLICMGVYAWIYLLYYLFTVRSYARIVGAGSNE